MSTTTDSARTALGAVLNVITLPVTTFGRFLGEWFGSRNWMWFLTSLPALLVGGLVLVGLVRARYSSDLALSNTYAKRATDAVKAEDYPRAEMMYRKAIKYRPGDQSLVFARGLVLDQLDQTDDAFRLMQIIAPLGENADLGYPRAHLWIAQSLLVEHVKVEENRLPLAESHLVAILKQEPENVDAHRLLANLALRIGNGNKALEHLSKIVDKYPAMRIKYAELLNRANRKEDARREADRCFDYYNRLMQRRRGTKNPPTAGEWLAFASSAVLLDRFRDATNILTQANNECEETKVIRQGIAKVLVGWTQRLDEVDTPNIGQQLGLLGEALRVAPDNPVVLQRIALLIGRDEGSDPIAEEMLKKALVDGTAPAIVHFLLGTRAATEGGDPEIAMSHLEQALKLNPNTAVVLNNLAWVISIRQPPDLERALEMVTQAIKLKKHQANFRDTRGQIYIKLGKWSDAIADLEIALGKLPNNLKVRESLALAYEKTGNADMAARHRKKADELKEAAKSDTTTD